MLKLICYLAALATLAACSTTPVAPTAAVPVPSDRVVWPAQSGDSKITVVRDAGFLGAGCYYALFVNRQLAARMDVGESVTLAVPSGDVLLGVRRDPAGKLLCSTGADPSEVQRETTLKSGESKAFRLVVNIGGGIDVMRSDF